MESEKKDEQKMWLSNFRCSFHPASALGLAAWCPRALMRINPIAMPCLSFPISKTAHRLLGEVSGSPEVRYGREMGSSVGHLEGRGKRTPKSPKRDPSEPCLEPVAQSCPCALRCHIAPYFPSPGLFQH